MLIDSEWIIPRKWELKGRGQHALPSCLRWAAVALRGAVGRGCDFAEPAPLPSAAQAHPSRALAVDSSSAEKELRTTSSSFPPPTLQPRAPVHRSLSSACELRRLTFLQQSLWEETILGARAGWEGTGRSEGKMGWQRGTGRKGDEARVRLISSP